MFLLLTTLFLFLRTINCDVGLENYKTSVFTKASRIGTAFYYREKLRNATESINERLKPLKKYTILDPLTSRVDKTLALTNKLSGCLLAYTAYDFATSHPEVVIVSLAYQYPLLALLGVASVMNYNTTLPVYAHK